MNLQDRIDESYPRYYDDEIDISKEQWKDLLQDSSVFNEHNLQHMKCLYSFDNHAATCKKVSEKLGETAQYYIGLANGLARRIVRKLKIENLPKRDGNDADVYWYILFYGQEVNDRKRGNFEWKIKPTLAAALKGLYPKLEYPQPIILKKLEDVPAAVWLATAMLAYETFNQSDKLGIEMMYFKQSDIQKKYRSFVFRMLTMLEFLNGVTRIIRTIHIITFGKGREPLEGYRIMMSLMG